MVHQDKIEISTKGNGDMKDITDAVNKIVKKSAIQTGMAHVFNIGSTGAVGS